MVLKKLTLSIKNKYTRPVKAHHFLTLKWSSYSSCRHILPCKTNKQKISTWYNLQKKFCDI